MSGSDSSSSSYPRFLPKDFKGKNGSKDKEIKTSGSGDKDKDKDKENNPPPIFEVEYIYDDIGPGFHIVGTEASIKYLVSSTGVNANVSMEIESHPHPLLRNRKPWMVIAYINGQGHTLFNILNNLSLSQDEVDLSEKEIDESFTFKCQKEDGEELDLIWQDLVQIDQMAKHFRNKTKT